MSSLPDRRQLAAQVLDERHQAGEVVDVGVERRDVEAPGGELGQLGPALGLPVATRATSWKRVATSVSTSRTTRRRSTARSVAVRRRRATAGRRRRVVGGGEPLGARRRAAAGERGRQHPVGDDRAEVVVARRAARGRGTGLVGRRRLERRDDEERRAGSPSSASTSAGPGDEALLHRLEQDEEVGDVAQEPEPSTRSATW